MKDLEIWYENLSEVGKIDVLNSDKVNKKGYGFLSVKLNRESKIIECRQY